jgi:DnaJ-class molecular chaperone
VVEQEIDLGQRHLDSGEFDLANLFFKNAASLEILTDPKQKAGRSATIIELRKKSETGGMTVQRKCPECGGTGKHVMEAAGMDNKVTTIEVAGKSCQRCGGTGNIMKPTTMDERRGKIGRAINKYTAIQQGRKYMPVGGAWVPSDLDGKLGVKQTVMLRRSAAPPCSECMGLGRVDCSKCNGMGEIKCTASGCINGIVESIDEGGLIKNKVKVKKKSKCRTCTGTGFVTCLSCRGKGNMVCKKCNSSGERQACTRCGGQGFTECRRCRGSGKTEKEAVCSECRGEGVELCSSCGGDGKKK